MGTSKNLQGVTYALTVLFLLVVEQSAAAMPVYEKGMRPLYKDANLAIHPESRHPLSNNRDWCGSRKYKDEPAKFEVVYDVPHKDRDALFSPGYAQFVDTIVRGLVDKYCQNKPFNVNLYFYRRGEWEHFDVIKFQIRSEDGKNIVSRITGFGNNAHPLNKARAAAEALGSCSGKPFCNLLGGIYLNAIYENNESLIRKLDKQIVTEVRNNPNIKNVEKMASLLGKADLFSLEGISLLKPMAIKYMALYASLYGKNTAETCLQAGAKRMVRKAKTDIVRFQDQFGIDQGSVGGIEFGEFYTINKEFFPLCNKICDASGSGGSDLFAEGTQSYKAKLVLKGIGQVLGTFDCNSAEVKQFERNLISLTEQYLQDPTNRSKPPQQPQKTAIRQNKRSRMARPAPAPVIDESVLYDLNGNLKKGAEFLAANKSKNGVIETASGLQYKIIKNGSGRTPKPNDRVRVHMRRTLLNGHVYSRKQSATFLVGSTHIKGVREGLQYVKPGGKIQLFIPPALAYGDRAVGGRIPAGSTLIYEIELISINFREDGVTPLALRGDLDADGDVDRDDLNIMMASRNQPARGANDPMDLDGDGVITVRDVRILQLLARSHAAK